MPVQSRAEPRHSSIFAGEQTIYFTSLFRGGEYEPLACGFHRANRSSYQLLSSLFVNVNLPIQLLNFDIQYPQLLAQAVNGFVQGAEVNRPDAFLDDP